MNLTAKSSMMPTRFKSMDFFRKIPRDLTEASVSGAGMSIAAAFFMIFLFGMELNNYLMTTTSTSVIVDNSRDGDHLRINFNVSFPALSCEFASVNVNDVLGTNRLNITKEVHKTPIDTDLKASGSGYSTGPLLKVIRHDAEIDVEYTEGAVSLNAHNFERASHLYSILVVNFFAPWCSWSKRLRPSWERAAKIMRERYDPDVDGRILVAKVDCTEEAELCKRHNIQGYPSIRIFRKGSNMREPESYYGDRDTDSLITTMEDLVAPISADAQKIIFDLSKHPAPSTGGCRLEGFVHVKKVPGNLVVSARSPAHSFDATRMNMSHTISRFSFGKKITAEGFNDFKRVLPYLGRSHERLNKQSYITDRGNATAVNVTIEHYLQVVKTEVLTRAHKVVEDYEYTAHSSLVHSPALPVAKFHYEISPMQVRIEEVKKSFPHFLTNLCAIIGGVFTVAGILDSILHNTIRLIKKVELGKNF
ncbi:protein disulfide isomerase-like 5-4 [Daucus carota subsp. sativus]|uniref:protein disulfide isomerase-like 5-4 n=1 Tax=Daucus carota subsp. sativus TaxID=79200 RepID=UPI003082BDF0